MNPTLAEQIVCVKRELAMRERVYPQQIARGLMSRENADREIARMKAVLGTLDALELHKNNPHLDPTVLMENMR